MKRKEVFIATAMEFHLLFKACNVEFIIDKDLKLGFIPIRSGAGTCECQLRNLSFTLILNQVSTSFPDIHFRSTGSTHLFASPHDKSLAQHRTGPGFTGPYTIYI